MKLKTIQIQNYKIIDDTKSVPIDERVTAFVGKNESGKTAILKALWKSKNVAGVQFDKLYDYPRDRYSRERKESQPIVTLEFALTPEESKALSDALPSKLTAPAGSATFTTSYKGEDHFATDVTFGDAQQEVEQICLRPAIDARRAIEGVVAAVNKYREDPGITSSAAATLGEIDAAGYLWDETTLRNLNSFNQAITNWLRHDSARNEIAKSERTRFEEILNLAKEGDPKTPARTWLTENLPTFIYFDDYGQLETRINLRAFLHHIQKPDAKTRTQQALFEWSGLDPKEILDLGAPKRDNEPDLDVHHRKEKRRALLDSASFSLTGDWIKWWEGKEHKLHFEADGDDLVLKVSDENNTFPLPFEERSQGFQWFFSFYLVFLVESKRAHKGSILLLDEPGLHLHPTLQAKLSTLFLRISDANQLLYSTHLPFLIDGDNLQRVRTVHLFGPKPQKTMVSNDVRPTGDKDTLFPLQAAVGYSIAQTLFLGKRSLIVEGITDYWILKALNDCIAATKKGEALHPDTILVPAGGTSRLMPLASIMFSTTGVDGRKLGILLDSDKPGHQAAKLVQDTFSSGAKVLLLGPAVGLNKATIEDLIPRDSYVAALKACGFSVDLNSEEDQMEMTTTALEKAFGRLGLGQFGIDQKAAAALYFLGHWAENPNALPTPTLTKALALVAAINKLFASGESRTQA